MQVLTHILYPHRAPSRIRFSKRVFYVRYAADPDTTCFICSINNHIIIEHNMT
jgi:hypothetical protein